MATRAPIPLIRARTAAPYAPAPMSPTRSRCTSGTSAAAATSVAGPFHRDHVPHDRTESTGRDRQGGGRLSSTRRSEGAPRGGRERSPLTSSTAGSVVGEDHLHGLLRPLIDELVRLGRARERDAVGYERAEEELA